VSSDLYSRANEEWSRGRLHSAFRLFLAAAKERDPLAFAVVGYFYSEGVGTKADNDAALYWYKRAHRCGSTVAANNIGVIYRDRNDLNRALAWFRRAIKLRDGDANLNIAKIYLLNKQDGQKATHYLNKAYRAKSNEITQQSRGEAKNLLKRIAKAASWQRAIRRA
jgi:TPR repeat protein